MASLFLNRDLELHPFLESIAQSIRIRRSDFEDLSLLEIDPRLTKIRGELEGNEVTIKNELYKARGLRKLHLEIAILGSSLQVLHCVFFPEPTFDIPIFGADIVVGPSGISAAIVDLSPVGEELPPFVKDELTKIQIPSFKNKRELPVWGSIFSSHVHFVRPDGSLEEKAFKSLLEKYLQLLSDSLQLVTPDSPDSPSTLRRLGYQELYCLQQKRNDKTRNILSKAFSPKWAEEYIDILLFEGP